MGGKLSARRKEKRNERQRTRDFLTRGDVLGFDVKDCEDEWSCYSGEISSWTKTEEKCYDPQDATLTFVEGNDDLDFLCEDFKSLRAKMSCGHAVTPMSLTLWCRCLLDRGEYKFVCGQTDCDVEWSFEEVCKMALLTEDQIEYFEKTVFSNASKDYLDVKSCPGCSSRVLRSDLHDLCVQCPVCTANKGEAYNFCWQCLKKWRGPRLDRCGRRDCQNPLAILRTCPDIIFEDVEGVNGCPSIRACPTCGLLVEHNRTQCKNIVCARCKVEFCFVCLKLTEECAEYDDDDDDDSDDDDSEHDVFYQLCPSGVAPRQTSLPVWKRT
ncbi:hypothetical protein PBY51_002825 [Eleginops maclovinus]|uniref:RBR-type E3 ubiquitin transferase n=1 Tax=Eleginops maclovinus TaxID=56733 RepID=A0AAN8AJR1_ELEMC|nr:hypothetical protein PBY51_002825 [Eleginops maclovinus]